MGIGVLGLALSVAGSLVQGFLQAGAAQAQAEAENNQLKMDMRTERIRGMQEANDRRDQYLRAEATNRVAAAVSVGALASNRSYTGAIAPNNKEVVGRDLATVQFNSAMEQDRMAYRIKVNEFEADTNGTLAIVGGFIDGFSQIGSYMSRPQGLLA